MTRDYAGKGRSRGRSRTARGRGNAPAKKPFPWPLALFAVAMLSLFGYVLSAIQGASEAPLSEHAPSAGSPAVQAQPEPKPEPAKPSQPLPEAPTERWEFIESLPNKEVQVELPEQRQSAGPFQMQCGSFRTDDQAQSMRATIAFQGLESEVRRTEGRNGVWYRVRLGPYERKRQAEAHRHTLERAGINGCQIWNWD
ncbi:SPOR domain-containing protein [Ferrimonas pelagia]|uniref:SPOR domain-containing protein n=1 Tax=Ferrimonas pelagia TaxID=1177826 RepID=A0ABP9F3R2_9GAMM